MTAATMRTNLFERFVPVIRSLTDADLDNGAVLGDYFLGRTNRGALSSKTNPEKLERAREALRPGSLS